ncbi:MAG: hypothetical protein NTX29_02975 [Actinobacteria bacterium]|nr:hypothetical protein [Actinomycetota bacterium]
MGGSQIRDPLTIADIDAAFGLGFDIDLADLRFNRVANAEGIGTELGDEAL